MYSIWSSREHKTNALFQAEQEDSMTFILLHVLKGQREKLPVFTLTVCSWEIHNYTHTHTHTLPYFSKLNAISQFYAVMFHHSNQLQRHIPHTVAQSYGGEDGDE